MLGSMITLVLVAVGAVLMLCIIAFGIYITFYPMLKTLAGAREVMKEHKHIAETHEEKHQKKEKSSDEKVL